MPPRKDAPATPEDGNSAAGRADAMVEMTIHLKQTTPMVKKDFKISWNRIWWWKSDFERVSIKKQSNFYSFLPTRYRQCWNFAIKNVCPFLGFCALSWARPYQKKLLKRKMENFVKIWIMLVWNLYPAQIWKFFMPIWPTPPPHILLCCCLLPIKITITFFATISKHHFFEKINPPKNLNVVKNSPSSLFSCHRESLKIDIKKFSKTKISQKNLAKKN